MVSKLSRRSERVKKTCKFAISTRDYNFGSNGLEVGNRFIESEDFCWANNWGISSVLRGVGGEAESGDVSIASKKRGCREF
jgi:hypothetical protein